MDFGLDLIEGRGCGDCTACCTIMTIDKPEIQKLAGLTCRHCVKGCAIYDTRPPLCREYHCGWKQLAMLDENWRPDRSGVLVEIEPVDDATGISLTLIANPLKTIRQGWFIDFVAVGVSQDIPLLLAIPGPVGHQGASLKLNTPLMKAASFSARSKVRELLEAALKQLRTYPFVPMPLTHQGNDVGVPLTHADTGPP